MRKIVQSRRRSRLLIPVRPVLEQIERRVLLTDFPVTNTLDSGPGSLRAAIESANLNFGPDSISFNIAPGGAQEIAPANGLPIVTEAITIDGTTQPGFAGTPLITLNGANVVTASGLRLSGGNSTVRGLRITGFLSNGIAIDTAGGNVIRGNELIRNALDGLNIGTSNNTVGGVTAADRNVLADNGRDGVRVATTGGSNNIRGNFVGLSAAGTALPNSQSGVMLFGPGNTVAGNVISANLQHGVSISGASAGGNIIQANFIGTNPAGTAAIGNGQTGVSGTGGVRILSAANTIVGGATAAERNVISGNFAEGVLIEGLGSNGTTVQGNFIGTNASGAAAVANGNDGIQIKAGAHSVTGNVLSGNGDDGIEIQSASSGSNVVQGNLIGTNAAGTAALPNGSDGVEIQGSSNNQIGGTTTGERNVIAANTSDGIEILADVSGGSTGNQIRGNQIGLGDGGQVLGNTRNGINLDAASATTVSGNTIANNGLAGVFVNDPATGNTVRQNSIFSNGGLGIDLAVGAAMGVTPNDAGDADAGANDLQNFPTITSVTPGGGGTLVALSLNSTPSATFTIDVYQSSAADASGNGEGQAFVGTATVATDAAGNATTTVNIGAIATGFVSATATNALGSTSEFGRSVAVGQDTVPPAVNASSFLFDGVTLPAPPHRLTYTFSENVSASLGANDLLLENLTSGQTVPATSIAVSYNAATNTATFTFPGFTNGILPDGRYRATLLAAGVTDAAGNPLATNHVSNFYFLQGDANHDANVNLADFNVLAANFGQSNRIFSQGDFNYDGQVNLNDFNILASRFGRTVAPSAGAGPSLPNAASKGTSRDALDDLLG